MRTNRLAFAIILIFPVCTCTFGQSVLSKGEWFKIAVEKQGVYKISFDGLRKMGINPSTIDPKTIAIYGNEGGMLPQRNDAPRPQDLQENAIMVVGEDDGVFDKQDFILFYADGAARADFDAARDIFHFRNNLYETRNFYFLTISDTPGKRITTTEDLVTEASLVTQYDDFVYHELDEHNELRSGREWFGEKFGLVTSEVIPFNVPGIVPGSDIKVVSDVVGQSYASASFKVLLNGIPIVEQPILPIPNGRYSIKGYERRDTVIVNEASVGAAGSAEHSLEYQFLKASGFSQGYLDFVLVSFKRQLRRYDNQTVFSAVNSMANPVSSFQVGGVTEKDLIWDVTDPYNITNQLYSIENGTASFTTSTHLLKTFIVFNSEIPAPAFVGSVPNQDLHGLSTPELIIVTHPSLRSEAERLGTFRQNSKGWTVQVVSTGEIYNEFSSGRQDVTAIRDFIRHLHDKSPGTIKAVLLFGKGSYDYKDRIEANTNFVPTYQSRESLEPLETYSSDDYYGFLDAAEGEWSEAGPSNETLDVGIGRLPVVNLAQAANIVDKLISYDTNPEAFGYWRKKIVFVADDGNSDDNFSSLHQFHADQLAVSIEEQEPGFDPRKIYMGTYQKTVRPNGETAPKMADDIVRAFEDGSLIINYTGHGSELVWADERVFSDQVIPKLRNKLFPFIITASCEFGRHDDPRQISSAELSINKKEGGAIGLVTTTRDVYANTNFDLNKAFYQALFTRTDNRYHSLGEVIKATKNNSVSGVFNRNFSLLADPSMFLALPQNTMVVTSIKTESGSDTLKALSRVLVKGYVADPGGQKLGMFNGEAEATLYDKASEQITSGRNAPPFQFREWDNVLFRGKAAVVSGEFGFEFILPKNIAYSIDEGKLGLYASDPSGQDANGFSNSFSIGGSEKSPASDQTPPKIELFMGDTTFRNGGVISPESFIVARLSDESGINISNYGIGNSIIAQLDGEGESFVLNDHYVADKDDFTKGTIRYAVRNLSPGRHTLTMSAWDVFNNPAHTSIEFVVSDGDEIQIETLGNYPNPFIDKTTIFFTHNRSGDDLEAQLFIYSPAGSLLEAMQIPITESEYKVDLLEWDQNTAGKKLPAGLYLARLIVRSLTNGSKNEQVTKLIILN